MRLNDKSKTRKTLGWWFIGFAIVAAAVILPGAREATSAMLYVIIFGGLFVAIPAILGIGLLTGRAPLK